jgi:hypothetical protein
MAPTSNDDRRVESWRCPSRPCRRLPRGTIIVALDRVGGSIKVWRVDGLDPPIIQEQWRATVIEVQQ